MSIKLRSYYKDSKGNDCQLSWAAKCDMMEMHCHVLPDCVGIPNIDRIYPLKQRIVRDIYNLLRDLDTVEELWVFGSSTNMMCNIYSDIDIAYHMKEGCVDNMQDLLYNCDPNGYDLIDLSKVKERSRLWGQIRKGARLL